MSVNKAILGGGVNPVRKTADDEMVEAMAENALDGLDDIEGLDEAVEEAAAIIDTEESIADVSVPKGSFAASYYEPKKQDLAQVKKPPVFSGRDPYAATSTETGYMQVKYNQESPSNKPYLT